MRDELKPAIDALQADLADLERQALETKLVINRLCVRAGLDPLYPDAAATAGPTMGSLRPDSFYGKSITTAAREFLEMRRSAGLGPATPREVYEALVKGGYTFEAKEEVTAIIGVRATLRKSSAIFHRLPNGTYGLLSWYPNAKPVREEDSDDEETPSKGAAKRGHRAKRHPKRKARSERSSEKAATHPSVNGESKADKVRRELRIVLADGPKNRATILAHMKAKGVMGSEQNPLSNLSQYHCRDGKAPLVDWRPRKLEPCGGMRIRPPRILFRGGLKQFRRFAPANSTPA